MDGALFPQPRRHLQSPGGGAGLLQAPGEPSPTRSVPALLFLIWKPGVVVKRNDEVTLALLRLAGPSKSYPGRKEGLERWAGRVGRSRGSLDPEEEEDNGRVIALVRRAFHLAPCVIC